jgi:hypothetical protein
MASTVAGSPGGDWRPTLKVVATTELTVTIARDLDPATISVEPIADPAACLLGPEPQDP